MTAPNICKFVIIPIVWIVCLPGVSMASSETVKPIDWGNVEVLDLKTAGLIALADNPDVAAVRERVSQAKEQVAQARSAYYPSLDAAGAVSRVDQSENALHAIPAPGITNPEDYYRADLTASWVLFNGFERKYTHASAKYGQSQSEYALKDARRLLLSAVSETYFAAQLALEQVAIAEADEAFFGRQLKEAEIRHKVGTGTLSDKLNFEVRANAARIDRIVANRDYETARIALAALLGIKNSRIPEQVKLKSLAPETETELSEPDVTQLINHARAYRPDVQQQSAALQQAEAQQKIAKAPFYPTINLSASLNGERASDAGLEHDDFGNTVAMTLTYNFFSGRRDRSRLREAGFKIKEVEKKLKQLNISVASDVQKSAAQVRQVQQALLLLRENARLFQQNRDLAEKEYKAGQNSLVRLNEAQRDLTAAQAAQAQSITALRQAWYDLKAETGQIESLFLKDSYKNNDIRHSKLLK